MDITVADLMNQNLLDVCNEPDPGRRNAAIALTYAEDVVWHQPDGIVRGRAMLVRRTAELHDLNPDRLFQPDGPLFVNDGLGIGRFKR